MRHGLTKAAGVVLLALALAVTQIPASYVHAVDGTAEYEKDGNSIISYTGTAQAVSVPNGITSISSESFSNNQSIQSLTFPASLTFVGNGAFRGCTNLREVHFGKGLKTLESGAFSMCPRLTKVTFSNTLYELGAGVFSGDNSLKEIDLNKNPYFVFQDGALYNKDKTKLYAVLSGRKADTYQMPDSVTQVERYAFWGCKNLRSVVLSSNLELIPEYAFSNCENLEDVTIPFSVRKIAAKAFEDCRTLRNITIPASVSEIHPTAFDGCDQVRILAQEGTSAYEFARQLETTLAASMENDSVSTNSIGSLYADRVKPVKEEETEEEPTEEEKKEAKKKGFDPLRPSDVSKADVSGYYANDADTVYGKTRVVNNQAVVLPSAIHADAANGTQAAEAETQPVIPKPVIDYDSPVADNAEHKLGFKAYYQNTSLNNADIEKGVTELGDLCFARSRMKAVRLPEGLTKIGYGAFYHCDSLADVEIPSTVTDIAPEAFEYTPYLKNWKQKSRDEFLIVGDGILIAYKGEREKVTLPKEVKKIAGEVFKGHVEILSVDLGPEVTEIGESAFEGCISLSSYSGGERVEKIADRAFSGCPLTSIHIPASVEKIGLGAFGGNVSSSVIFLAASELPGVSYEKTATRLDKEAYRVSPFGNTPVAVVSPKIRDYSKTVLDENLLGFKGIVVSIISDQDKTAKLEYCTIEADPVTKIAKVPDSVIIDGESYKISQAGTNAFHAYQNLAKWSENEIQTISLPSAIGTIDQYEPSLGLSFDLNSVTGNASDTDSDKTGSDDKDGENTELITTANQSSYPNGAAFKAYCLDDTEKYQLLVQDGADASKLKSAVEGVYGTLISGQITTFDLQLIEERSKVPISLFGKEQVEIWVPVSDTLYSQDICAVTQKEAGQLETIYGYKTKSDDGAYFVFRTNHFSTYGIYAGIGKTAETIRLESKKWLSRDPSPRTGDWLNPKWFLAAGCLFAGLFLLLQKKRI